MAKLYSVEILAALSLLQVTGSSISQTPTNIIKSTIPASNGMDNPAVFIKEENKYQMGVRSMNNPAIFINEVEKYQKGLRKSEVCYPSVGCFSWKYPWTSVHRPFPAPWSPTTISPTISLFTRSSGPYNIHLQDSYWSLRGSNFNPHREVTVVMTHGFSASGEEEWLSEMVVAYLKNKDANAFILDWGKGATTINYLQVASNTRVVGAVLARFLRYLINRGLRTEKIHLIGHSLGSHIMSYCAKDIAEISKVKRITGLDPAQPGFQGTPATVRLDPSDAEEVDVIHTDARLFIPFFGFGMLTPVGTVDFYMNGGSSQPGCLEVPKPNITSNVDLVKYPVEVITDWVSCSHGRSHEYFIAALTETDCSFVGRKVLKAQTHLKYTILGTVIWSDPIVKDLNHCTLETCNLVGLNTFLIPARGVFTVTTTGTPPYCDETARRSTNLIDRLTSRFSKFISRTFRRFIDSILGI
ncbi:pancreatic triacylglycerol lipase isoform X1 [Halyomorpha halys]|uniref:pancreatic triacylglycerol lipase isoform X1 n=1 Tax=Halyomorpha halys TaxID=286706 RepID=UPI0006D4CC0B|nr:pancreatic triacylglycerol lipase-like isoform X1 [Halyomorpha halys]XP_014273124.1 pancreatic triacylglycerol lipase-like isoform X1 [Halyomorpha halys]XP_014273125.1 pancreatic triacylglycerol lipase-like isoform X1 [Halyomorpha halys]